MDPRSSKQDDLSPRGRGGDIVFPHIEQYLENLETTRDAVLIAMERQATEQDFPIVGPLVGRMICMLAQGVGAKRILEWDRDTATPPIGLPGPCQRMGN